LFQSLSGRPDRSFPTDELLTWNLSNSKTMARSDSTTLATKHSALTAAPGHTMALLGTLEGGVFCDLLNGKLLASLKRNKDHKDLSNGVFSPKGDYYVLCTGEEKTPLWIVDVRTGKN